MNSSKTETMHTIEQLIQNGRDTELTFANSSILCGDSNISFTYRSCFDRHIQVLKSISVLVELNNEDYIKYKYNPHLLSYVLYGTTDLWFILLKINNMIRLTDFDRKKLYVIDPHKTDIINDLHIIEKGHLENYQDFDEAKELRRN